MFTKILIAEDSDSDNLGMISKLQSQIPSIIDATQSCDKAVLLVKSALEKRERYDLLITDLSFIPDHKLKPNITEGKELIKAVRALQPEIKIIVFSQKNNPAIIKSLFENYRIDGYVCKGLYSLSELIKAVKSIYHGFSFKCPIAQNAMNQNLLQPNAYEVAILQLLAKGYKQDAISIYFKEQGITPDSKRSIEDRLRKLREDQNVKTNIELVLKMNKLGVIS